MNSLPSEILHDIFTRVPLKQRLECMLVCRYWANSLRERSLLYDVEINNDLKFDNFIDLFQRLPRRRFQVEFLKITTPLIYRYDKRKLCNLLPNLREFQLHCGRPGRQHEDFCDKPFELENPNSKLEVICDGLNCELTRHLIAFGLCTRLWCLQLTLSQLKDPRKQVFIQLKGVPTLRQLSLTDLKMGIEDCEMIHKNVPGLEILELYSISLFAGVLPQDIIPATNVEILEVNIDYIDDFDTYPNWYGYLTKKYTNLTSFEYYDQGPTEIGTSQTLILYRDGILPLYKNLGNHINFFFACNIPTELNTFNVLDEFNLQIKKFTLNSNYERPIFEQLAESDQSKYVRHLTLEFTAISSPIMLKNFTSLKTMTIDEDSYDDATWNLNITDLFNAFPDTLTSFKANVLDAVITEIPTHLNNIEHFAFECSTISPKLAKAISNCFPKVNNLRLKGQVTENITINLPTNHFQEFVINANYSGYRPHGFSVTTADSSQPEYYIISSESVLLPPTEKVLRERVIVNITFATAKKRSLCSSYCDIQQVNSF